MREERLRGCIVIPPSLLPFPMEKCQALQHRSAKGAGWSVGVRTQDGGGGGSPAPGREEEGDQVTLQSSSSPGGSQIFG